MEKKCEVCKKQLIAKSPGTLRRKKYCDDLCCYKAKEIKRKAEARIKIIKTSSFS